MLGIFNKFKLPLALKKYITLVLFLSSTATLAQKLDTLSIEKIMRDPKWIGLSPSNISWSANSKMIYFTLDPHNGDPEELYEQNITDSKPNKISASEKGNIPILSEGEWNKKHTLKVYEQGGDIFLLDVKTTKKTQLTYTSNIESEPSFINDESKIIFKRDNNLYSLSLNNGGLIQLTNFVANSTKQTNNSVDNQQEHWLKAQQLELFNYLKQQDKNQKLDSVENALNKPKGLKEIVTGNKRVSNLQISPDGRFITYSLVKSAEHVKSAIVPNYVTSTGFTEDIPNRTKVGVEQAEYEQFVFDTQRDSVYKINIEKIPGIKDLPDYVKDYPAQMVERIKLNLDRKLYVDGTYWSALGKNCVVVVSSFDHKDKWIMKLDPLTGNLSPLNRERNEAWVGGPGQYNFGYIDETHFYFESEQSGYAHIYVIDLNTNEKKQITNGNWEVQTLQLSTDKKYFYFTANMEHPGITHFYKLPVSGGNPVKLTSMKGMNEVTLSPDENWLAIRYSYTNQPWELYLQANKPGAKPVKLTNFITDEFKSYPWRDPEMITFKNRYGNEVYAHLYLPKKAIASKPAVVFVHGAGYLQNVTYGWSYYFHEFLFNNLLADKGYTVIDIDYSGSAGYGRDWRTAIYRHMGGKDLSDQVDGVKMLVDKYGINPNNVGIYGGSYGGFITLMALFTEPNVFKAGAAIRSVTDWAHYNHEYTSEILNEPFYDEKAYRASSPIYFANGLKGNLLMLHGVLDQNVNYQDIVRLSQKLIELQKDNWELASYPVEDHAFLQPSSWTDEYKRIFKLFEQHLTK